MPSVKLVENYAIATTRQDVRDALTMAGEQCILLSMFHPEIDKDHPRCSFCNDDVYSSSDSDCPYCFGTSMYPPIKDARKVYGLFTDHVVSEQFQRQGMWAADAREVQFQWWPMLIEHDFIARVRQWSDGKPTELEGFYGVQAVTRDSLRTGTRFGQYSWDVIGQRALVSRLAANLPIYKYPIIGQEFGDETGLGVSATGVVTPPAPTREIDVYTFIQPTPLNPWVIVHPVGITPSVELILDGEEVDAEIIYSSPDTVTVRFDEIAVSGTAELVRTLPRTPAPFIFEQVLPVDPWVIVHPLDHLPVVRLIVGGEEVEAPVTYPSPDTVVVTFEQPTSGTAELE